MPSAGIRRLIQGQGGSTLIELLVAMPIAIFAVGLSVQFFASAHRGHREVEARATALSSAQTSLERMTRELRQADWVYFRSSQLVDMLTPVRLAGSTTSTPRLVRYQCGGGRCVRYQGPATTYPPPSSPSLTQTALLLTGLVNADVFHPQRIDPATGLASADFLNPDSVILRAKLTLKANTGQYGEHDLEVHDGVSLRNNTRFTG